MLHTPGPYRVERNHNGMPIGISAPATMRYDLDFLCLLEGAVNPANAFLFAASPDLLESVQMLVRGLKWHIENHPEIIQECDHEALQFAEAAIAKAAFK